MAITATTAAVIAATAASLSATGYQLAQGSPDAPRIPPAPKVSDKAVQEAAAEAARRRARARGFRSTILSQNFLEPANPALQQTLGS